MLFTTIVNAKYLPGLFALLRSVKANGGLVDARMLAVVEQPLSGEVEAALRDTGISVDFLAAGRTGQHGPPRQAGYGAI